jgi:hypothetical protein
MEKEFSRPQWVMIKSVAKVIRADMRIDEKDLSILDLPITVSKIGPSLPERFHLRSQKGNPGLVGIFDRIMMPGLLVLTDQLFTHIVDFT